MAVAARLRAVQGPRITRRSAASLVGAGIVGLLLAAWLRGAAEGTTPVSFVTYGVASAPQALSLRSLPGGGEVLTGVPSGSRLGVGGRVPLLSGASRADALWVALASDTGVIHGFVPAEAVVLVAGRAPVLDLSDVPVAELAGRRSVEVAAAPKAASSPLGIPWLPSTLAPWEPFFHAAAAEHGVDPGLLAIITLVESGGRPEALSGAGAVGLMQIMPSTAADIARWRGLEQVSNDELAQPGVNIDFGAYYLARMLGRFGVRDDPDWQRSVELAAAAYNGGPGAAQRWLAGGSLPDETDRYRRYVLGMWLERSADASPTFAAWCAAGGTALVPAQECPGA